MRSVCRYVVVVMIVGFVGCAENSQQVFVRNEASPKPRELKQQLTTDEWMNASYYGKNDGMRGKKTASGEPFNPQGYTAAHKTLPFGTKLELTNPETGKTTVVRINDRGPYVKGRALDVSHAAAKALGITGDGVQKLKTKILPPG